MLTTEQVLFFPHPNGSFIGKKTADTENKETYSKTGTQASLTTLEHT